MILGKTILSQHQPTATIFRNKQKPIPWYSSPNKMRSSALGYLYNPDIFCQRSSRDLFLPETSWVDEVNFGFLGCHPSLTCEFKLHLQRPLFKRLTVVPRAPCKGKATPKTALYFHPLSITSLHILRMVNGGIPSCLIFFELP